MVEDLFGEAPSDLAAETVWFGSGYDMFEGSQAAAFLLGEQAPLEKIPHGTLDPLPCAGHSQPQVPVGLVVAAERECMKLLIPPKLEGERANQLAHQIIVLFAGSVQPGFEAAFEGHVEQRAGKGGVDEGPSYRMIRTR